MSRNAFAQIEREENEAEALREHMKMERRLGRNIEMKKDNFPAFNTHFSNWLTARDYFAAHCPLCREDAEKALAQTREPYTNADVITMLCLMRYDYADKMLKARKE